MSMLKIFLFSLLVLVIVAIANGKSKYLLSFVTPKLGPNFTPSLHISHLKIICPQFLEMSDFNCLFLLCFRYLWRL